MNENESADVNQAPAPEEQQSAGVQVPGAYPTDAEVQAGREKTLNHPFVAAVKQLLDILATQPKVGWEYQWQEALREYRNLIGE